MIQLDSIGAEYNAMTGHEFTLYYVSGDPRDAELLLDIIIDLYLHPIYPEEDIEKERTVVLEELRINEDKYSRLLSNKMYNEIYTGLDDTLSRPIIGFKESISIMNRNDIINYRKKNYIGSNCILCVSGNFNKSEIKKQIKLNFNTSLDSIHIPYNMFHKNVKKDYNIKPILKLNPNIKNKHIHIHKDNNQTIINFMFNCYNNYNKYGTVASLIGDILSNGFSSRLFNLLRNKMGVSYYNSSFHRSFTDQGNFIISVGVDHVSVNETVKNILLELKNIVNNGVLINELNKSKKQNETGLLFRFKDPYEYMMYYGLNLLYKTPLYDLNGMLNEISSVTFDEINNVIKQIFQSSNFIIGTVGQVNKETSDNIIKYINEF
jgi:predicted Zn-dependent peptidase